MTNIRKLKIKQPKTDENLWEDYIKDIKPIKKIDRNEDSQPLIIDIKEKENSFYAGSGINLPPLEKDSTAGIDNQTAKKFKREEYKIEAVLDLHGKTEKDAYDKVYDFIIKAYNRGQRCILIITGKGINPHENEDIFAARGILKESVPNWLRSEELRPMIMAFKHPSEAKGGSGALYILLRRKKS